MIGLKEFMLATGAQEIYDKATGGVITAAEMADYGEEREIMNIKAVTKHGRNCFEITVGRRKHAR